jgi:hypothetical protein
MLNTIMKRIAQLTLVRPCLVLSLRLNIVQLERSSPLWVLPCAVSGSNLMQLKSLQLGFSHPACHACGPGPLPSLPHLCVGARSCSGVVFQD